MLITVLKIIVAIIDIILGVSSYLTSTNEKDETTKQITQFISFMWIVSAFMICI